MIKMAKRILYLFFTCIFLLMTNTDIYSRKVLEGLIIQQDNGKPIDLVFIKVRGANPTVTESDGQYKLEFLYKKPGQKIVFNCEKQGMEVVNRNELSFTFSDQPNDLLHIVMDIAGNRVKNASMNQENFLKSIYTTQAEIFEDIRKQKINPEEKDKRFHDLQTRSISAFEGAELAAERFSEEIPHKDSILYKNAFNHYKKGEYEKALNVLDNEKIDKEESKQRANCYMLKARLSIILIRFDEVESYFQKAIEADPKSIYLSEFASFLYGQIRYSGALSKYTKALSIARTDVQDVQRAHIFSDLGVIFLDMPGYESSNLALDQFNEALKIYKELAKENPDVYLPEVAEVLTNMGIYYSRKNLDFIDEAIKAYEDALKIVKKLSNKKPKAYLPLKAKIYNNWGYLYEGLGEEHYGQAFEKYNKALNIYRKLAAEYSYTYSPVLARTLNNLGNLYRNTLDFEKAMDVYNEVLKLRKKLAKENPRAFEAGLANAHISIGFLYWDRVDIEKTDSYRKEVLFHFERAITILEKYQDIPTEKQKLKEVNDLLVEVQNTSGQKRNYR